MRLVGCVEVGEEGGVDVVVVLAASSPEVRPMKSACFLAALGAH